MGWPAGYSTLSTVPTERPTLTVLPASSRCARERQRARFAGRQGMGANAHMRPRELREFCGIGEPSVALLKAAMTRLGLSTRAYHRVLKIARTLADLDDTGKIGTAHVA